MLTKQKIKDRKVKNYKHEIKQKNCDLGKSEKKGRMTINKYECIK